jgi:hypothetical protein
LHHAPVKVPSLEATASTRLVFVLLSIYHKILILNRWYILSYTYLSQPPKKPQDLDYHPPVRESALASGNFPQSAS